MIAPPSAPVDDRTAALLRHVSGQEQHRLARERIVAAIATVADENGGRVDPNAVRALLSDERGLTVPPRVVGSVYYALSEAGALHAEEWTVSNDRRGRNIGKPARVYRLVGMAA